MIRYCKELQGLFRVPIPQSKNLWDAAEEMGLDPRDCRFINNEVDFVTTVQEPMRNLLDWAIYIRSHSLDLVRFLWIIPLVSTHDTNERLD